ncbi:MFS transporter [Saliphagus sp. GCM10025334]
MPSEDTQSFSPPRLVTLLLIGVIASFSGGLINPTIPAIQSSFAHLPNSETLAQLVSTMSAPIVVIVAPIVGYLLDRHRRKPILIAAILIYGVGTSIAFFLDSLYLILATRVLDGIAVAAVMVTVPTLISDYYSGGRRESVMGWYGAVQAGGGAVAVIIGGLIADVNWKYIFLVFALALLLIPPVIRYLPEPDVTRSPSEVGRLEAVAKIVRDSPIFVLVGIYLVVAFAMLTNNLIHIEAPYYLQNTLGISGSMTGVTLSAAMVAGVVAAASYGRVKKRCRHITIVAFAFTTATIGYVIISAMDSFPVVFVGIVIGACGLGFILPTANDWVAAVVHERYRGRALSGVTMMMYLGFAISPFAPAPLIDQFGRSTTFFVWAGFLLVAAVGATALWWVSEDSVVSAPAEAAD